ncbi:lytic polysaccharide monooxygenase [Macroventuria anomochaeta]|uniref:Lytic polysaccharide monooxygenase n=1 Tax=Macroventuria anomochaeta TaxID=301207 RepID=A0ACB6RPF0_9PLEO|nr:lytic polysaccharide monooxygenase [Macroventuria anomochaeta]KAF2623820.1 lytic polysaccharide monooxygenase [Macroventuria anomochaeta]
MVYIAPADSNGEGAVWTKLYEDGLTNGKWAVETFITNKGQITITLPDLAAGEYLIRPEIIALHEGNRQGGAQFYNGCGQIKVTGSGSASLPATGVDMTKAYSATDPGVLFDIYSGATTYEMPGPAVWDGASGSTPSKTATASSAAATSAAATSAAPASSAAATSAAAEATPVASDAAAPAPTTGSGSGSTLPEEFTIQEFIAWLKETTGATGASKARRHARSFFG